MDQETLLPCSEWPARTEVVTFRIGE